jgi:uncharacterized membrane protein YvlD (DUF360 family)
MLILLRLAILTATVLLCARFIQGVKVKSIPAAVGVAVVFSVLNWLLAGVLKVLFFLPAILTLGLLFLFLPLIINAILLWLTDKALHVFEIETGKAHWLMALIITLVNAATYFALR